MADEDPEDTSFAYDRIVDIGAFAEARGRERASLLSALIVCQPI